MISSKRKKYMLNETYMLYKILKSCRLIEQKCCHNLVGFVYFLVSFAFICYYLLSFKNVSKFAYRIKLL